jgi:hypothetical protein
MLSFPFSAFLYYYEIGENPAKPNNKPRRTEKTSDFKQLAHFGENISKLS